MFPERDTSKVKIAESFPIFFDKLKPIVSSLKFGVSAYSRDRLIGE